MEATARNGARWSARLAARTAAVKNAVCAGIDPVLSKLPGEGRPEERVKRFYLDMLDAFLKRGVLPAAAKPNSAYFEALGIPALSVLVEIIRAFRAEGVLVLLDAKRGDIGTTSRAYAEAAFSVFGADAVTVAPYMGLDTVKPFLDLAQGQGVYVLCRTSNPSARDFQEVRLLPEAEGGAARPLYRRVADRLGDWSDGNLGAVIGATAPSELEEILGAWVERGCEMPVLIPGIPVPGVSGGQSGDPKAVREALRRAGANPRLHLVNSSSGINYAYEKFRDLSPAEASARALEELAAEFPVG